MKIGITAPGYNVEPTLVDRFKDYALTVLPPDDSNTIYITSLESEVLHPGTKQFSRSKALNSGIKELMNHGCDVIICTDLDMIIPPNLVAETAKIAIRTNKNVFSMTRFIDWPEFQRLYPNWDLLRDIPSASSGRGGWNAMSAMAWKLSGGWNEELYEWGYEDIEFHSRIKRKGIDNVTLNSFPLLHINHPPRNPNQTVSQRNNVAIASSQDFDNRNWIMEA